MAITKLYFVPLAMSLLMLCTYLLTYICAVSFDHAAAVFPYISDTGTIAPESCVFAQSMNIIAVLNFVFAWIRYSHVKVMCSADVNFSYVLCLNRWAYWNAISMCIGFSMVGNFSETGSLLVHGVGAFLLFVPGMAYVVMQAVISVRTINVISSRPVAITRIILGSLAILCGIIELIVLPSAFYYFRGDNFRKWKPDDGGYELHLVSAISEWILGIGYAVFTVTFIGEFQDIQVEAAKVRLLSETGVDVEQQAQLSTSDQQYIQDDNVFEDDHCRQQQEDY